MAVLLLTSAAGSPGVTTLAVGLALTWPRPVLLADCDPGAHQAVLAGFLAGQSAGGRGLLRVAEAHRDRRPLHQDMVGFFVSGPWLIYVNYNGLGACPKNFQIGRS